MRPAPLVRTLALAGLLFCFFVGLDMMGLSFKLFGKGLAEELIARTSNPFVGLLSGCWRPPSSSLRRPPPP